MKDHIIDPFSLEWIVTNSVTIFSIFMIIYIGKYILKTDDQKIRLGYLIGAILLARFFASHLYQINNSIWNPMESLPLQLCGISAIISSILLFRFNQFFYEFLVLLGLPGAIISLVTPELTMGFSEFLRIEYFVSHGGIILSALYLTFILGHRPSLGSWKKIAVASQVVLLVAYLSNKWLNYIYPNLKEINPLGEIGDKADPLIANYMYTVIPPDVDLPLLVWDKFYYVGFEIFGFIFLMTSYYFFTRGKSSLREIQ